MVRSGKEGPAPGNQPDFNRAEAEINNGRSTKKSELAKPENA
jgi:hypothetical protein